jgi:hypothetical protein
MIIIDKSALAMKSIEQEYGRPISASRKYFFLYNADAGTGRGDLVPLGLEPEYRLMVNENHEYIII